MKMIFWQGVVGLYATAFAILFLVNGTKYIVLDITDWKRWHDLGTDLFAFGGGICALLAGASLLIEAVVKGLLS